MRTLILTVTLLVSILMLLPMIQGGKPSPTVNEDELRYGNLQLTMGKNLAVVFQNSDIQKYVRVFEWKTIGGVGYWDHVWSGDCGTVGMDAIIGDVDNDGDDELVVQTSTTVKISTKVSETKRYITIWENGDHSSDPSGKIEIGSIGQYSSLGDIDGDSDNELIILSGSKLQIMDISCINGNYIDSTLYSNNYGGWGLEVANTDNDNMDEIIIADDFSEDFLNGCLYVVEWQNDLNVFSLKVISSQAMIGCSVGDFDGIGYPEIFAIRNRIGYYEVCIIRYDPLNTDSINGYSLVWTKTYDSISSGDSYDYFKQCVVTDLDGDGSLEAIGANGMGYDRQAKKWIARVYVWDNYQDNSGNIIFNMNYADYSGSIEIATGRFNMMVMGYPDTDGCGRVQWGGSTFEDAYNAGGNLVCNPISNYLAYGNYANPFIS